MCTSEPIPTALVCSWEQHLLVRWIPQNLNETVSKKAQDFIDGIGVFGLLGIIAQPFCLLMRMTQHYTKLLFH
jgi:hypothetical protein